MPRGARLVCNWRALLGCSKGRMRHVAGDNFTIDLEDGVAVCRLFKRADLDPPAIVRAAVELVKHARVLALNDDVTGMVVDLRRVPGAVGPEIASAYGDLGAIWEHTAQRVAFLVIDDAMQMLQLGRILNEKAPRFGSVFSDRNDARTFAGATGINGPNTHSRLFEKPSRIRNR